MPRKGKWWLKLYKELKENILLTITICDAIKYAT